MMETTECRWVAPLDEEDREYFSYFRTVCKRYDIVPPGLPVWNMIS